MITVYKNGQPGYIGDYCGKWHAAGTLCPARFGYMCKCGRLHYYNAHCANNFAVEFNGEPGYTTYWWRGTYSQWQPLNVQYKPPFGMETYICKCGGKHYKASECSEGYSFEYWSAEQIMERIHEIYEHSNTSEE